MLSEKHNSRNIQVLENTCQNLRKLLDELFQERERKLSVYIKFLFNEC